MKYAPQDSRLLTYLMNYMRNQLKDRQPCKRGNRFCWTCANEDAKLEDVLKFEQCMLPWKVSGSLGSHYAEYATKEQALQALEHGLKKYEKEIQS